MISGRAFRLRLQSTLAALLLLGTVFGHQELLFARLTTQPPQPQPGEPFELLVTLSDSSDRQVGGAQLVALLADADAAEPDRTGSGQAALAPGVTLRNEPGTGRYRGSARARPAGDYRLELVELTNDQPEASASTTLTIGGGSPVDVELVLPPSNENGLGAWLLWLLGLPLLAGLLVAVLVFTGRRRTDSE